MENKNINVVASPNVEGNIGSCAIKKEVIPVQWNMSQSIAVNSCSGKVVADYTYVDFPAVVFGGAILIIASFIGLGLCISIASKDTTNFQP